MQPPRCPYRGNASALWASRGVHNNPLLFIFLLDLFIQLPYNGGENHPGRTSYHTIDPQVTRVEQCRLGCCGRRKTTYGFPEPMVSGSPGPGTSYLLSALLDLDLIMPSAFKLWISNSLAGRQIFHSVRTKVANITFWLRTSTGERSPAEPKTLCNPGLLSPGPYSVISGRCEE